jgi:photosystem II stability/assembly factor-like uncharacterized protein
MMEASHFDFNEAYAAVDRHQLDDFTPHIYRTRDLGKSWQDIARGLPRDGYVHFVKEDPKRRGLLFAGTERGVFMSFDDGDNWQSLQLNLPSTSYATLRSTAMTPCSRRMAEASGCWTTLDRCGN